MSENKEKPFDEQTLAKVLEAAYVLQEHNRAAEENALEQEIPETAQAPLEIPVDMPAPVIAAVQTESEKKPQQRPPAPEDYGLVLAEIVETQHEIQKQELKLDASIALVTDRAAEIARANGASVAILEGPNVHYRASSGVMALPIGTQVSMEKALCAATLRIGQVVRCEDVNVEFLVDLDECRRRGIQAMISAPVFVAGNVAGALELYYNAAQAFVEQDVHTCQLMAGLVGEALARDRGVVSDYSESKASPRSIESALSTAIASDLPKVTVHTPIPNEVSPKVIGACEKCGSDIVEDEQFCGGCGLPVGDMSEQLSPGTEMTSLKAPTDGRGEALDSGISAEKLPSPADLLAGILADDLSEQAADTKQFSASLSVDIPVGASALALTPKDADLTTEKAEGETAEKTLEGAAQSSRVIANWGSAAAARDFLEQLAAGRGKGAFWRFLKARRGDIYLALALLLVACVIRWGIWSGRPVSATGNPAASASHRRPDADLPLYDRMLIKFGLADAPDPPEDKGNPDTQVWVDVRTALYYCPGADLYGKTPKGKFSSQRDAQLDQYEPATRKACD